LASLWAPSNNQGTNTAYNNQFKVLEKGYNVLNTTLYGNIKLPFNITLNTNYSPRYQWFYNRYFESSQNPLWSDNGKVIRESERRFDWQIDNTLNWEATFNQKAPRKGYAFAKCGRAQKLV
jgi:DnaJ-class molecular chaperone